LSLETNPWRCPVAPPNITVHDPPGPRAQVEEMLRRRDPFNSIEAFINSTDVDPDLKAALWLLAWSEQSHMKRRALVREALIATTRAQG
jgi:hypothetical protein